jgi:hypothetical protein
MLPQSAQAFKLPAHAPSSPQLCALVHCREICKPDILPHALLGIVTWAVFGSLSNEALPTALAEAPYHLSAQLVGVSATQVQFC